MCTSIGLHWVLLHLQECSRNFTLSFCYCGLLYVLTCVSILASTDRSLFIVHGEYPFLDILSVDKVRIPWCLLVVCNHCTLKNWVIFPVPAIWLIVPTFSEIPSAWLPSTAPNQVIRGTAIPLSHLVPLRGLAFHAVPDWLKCQHFLVKPSEGIKLQNAMSSVTDT